jgi:hypothetical protein
MQWHKGPQQQQPHCHPNDETVPMDVDTVMAAHRAVTAEDKKKHHNEGRCYNCSKQGHLAHECPNKKSLQTQQCKPLKPNQKKNTKFRPRTSFARVIIEEDSDDEDFFEEVESDDKSNDQPNIAQIAAQTASFSDEEHEQWAKEMQKNGVNFQ